MADDAIAARNMGPLPIELVAMGQRGQMPASALQSAPYSYPDQQHGEELQGRPPEAEERGRVCAAPKRPRKAEPGQTPRVFGEVKTHAAAAAMLMSARSGPALRAPSAAQNVDAPRQTKAMVQKNGTLALGLAQTGERGAKRVGSGLCAPQASAQAAYSWSGGGTGSCTINTRHLNQIVAKENAALSQENELLRRQLAELRHGKSQESGALCGESPPESRPRSPEVVHHEPKGAGSAGAGWTQREDALLRQMVLAEGFGNWEQKAANFISRRTPNALRQRWSTHHARNELAPTRQPPRHEVGESTQDARRAQPAQQQAASGTPPLEGYACPFCSSDTIGGAKTRKRRRKPVARQQKFGCWWRGVGYGGPPYCQRCSEIFRDHLIRQYKNSAMCTREAPCGDCTKILGYVRRSSNEELWKT